MPACGTSYHTMCIRVGPPFVTRLKRNAGLCFPRVTNWGTFICELCTVRSVLQREPFRPSDQSLLRLERMRLIDMAHAWAAGTHKQYQSKLGHIRKFEALHDFRILPVSTLQAPPSTIDIPLMWIMESYSLRPSSRRTNSPLTSFGTIRHLRSAASQFLGWEMMLESPLSTLLDQQQRVLLQPCRPTDSYSFSLFTKGFSSRLGTESNPSSPLLFRHVLYMDRLFASNYKSATNPLTRRRWALAGLANLLFWLGWFRASEVFNLSFGDVDVVTPPNGPQYDLPPGIGLVLLRLLPQTKSNRTARADVVISYTSMSGLSIGTWCRRVSLSTLGVPDWPLSVDLIFQDPDGTLWTSQSFRNQYIYPCLLQLQAAGDAFLQPFTGTGNTIMDKFWSLHMYRRGARTHVGRGGTQEGISFKRATPSQIYEHGRWRRRRSSEAIDLQYSEWTYADRLFITLFCQ